MLGTHQASVTSLLVFHREICIFGRGIPGKLKLCIVVYLPPKSYFSRKGRPSLKIAHVEAAAAAAAAGRELLLTHSGGARAIRLLGPRQCAHTIPRSLYTRLAMATRHFLEVSTLVRVCVRVGVGGGLQAAVGLGLRLEGRLAGRLSLHSQQPSPSGAGC